MPDGFRRLLVEQIIDIEIPLQFEMCPMVNRVPQGVRNRVRPSEKLFVGRCRAGTEALGNAVSAHGSPFVVITRKPDLVQVFEATVDGDIGCVKVRMIVDDWLQFRVLVITALCHRQMKNEIFMNTVKHSLQSCPTHLLVKAPQSASLVWIQSAGLPPTRESGKIGTSVELYS